MDDGKIQPDTNMVTSSNQSIADAQIHGDSISATRMKFSLPFLRQIGDKDMADLTRLCIQRIGEDDFDQSALREELTSIAPGENVDYDEGCGRLHDLLGELL